MVHADDGSAGPSGGAARTEVVPWSDELVRQWDELALRVGATPFMRPGWFSAWLAAFGGHARLVVDRDRDGRLLGVLPLVGRLGVLESPTNWHTAEFGLVTVDAESAQRLLRSAVLAGRRRLRLTFVDHELARLTQDVAAGLRRPCGSRVYQESRFVPAPEPGTPSPSEVLSADKRKKSRRWRRQLAQHGLVRLDVGSADGQALEEFLAVEDAGWKSANGTSVARDTAAQAFYRRIARWAAEQGLLRIALLRVDDRVVAGDLAIEDDRAHHVLKTGFDEEYAAVRPGYLLRLDMLERAHAAGMRYEFLGSDAEWKRRWTPHLRTRYRVTVHGHGVTGTALRVLDTVARPAAKRVLTWWRQRRGGASAPSAD